MSMPAAAAGVLPPHPDVSFSFWVSVSVSDSPLSRLFTHTLQQETKEQS